MCSAACLRLKSIQKQLPNWAPYCSKFIPGWLQNPPQNGSKMCLKTLLERSWEPLGYDSIFRSLIFGSSWPLGALLEPSGPKRTNWKRLLDGPRPPRRPVSACLGAKYPPKRGPGGSKNSVRKRSKLKMAKPLKSPTVARILMIFQVPSSLFGAKNWSKKGSESHLRRGRPRKASWKPLGTLLEALGAEKTKLESLLERS